MQFRGNGLAKTLERLTFELQQKPLPGPTIMQWQVWKTQCNRVSRASRKQSELGYRVQQWNEYAAWNEYGGQMAVVYCLLC